MSSAQTGTITTSIPARLDRLPWSRFHWRIVFGLGTAWVLDGLEVTMVASVGSRLTQKNAGLGLTVSQIGVAGAIYIVGACVGALFFGQMCDRFGRKKLFVITLAFYIVSTVITAFSFAPWFFFLARFLTGAGIGGEYSAINSAIDELIPARARGRIDLMINGSYWLGSIIGSGVALFFLSAVFPANLGWRLAFGVGAVIGLAVMFVRRKVPESPRWLFIHGREQDAEAIVDGLEQEVEQETGQELADVDKSITVRQRKTIPFRELAAVAFKLYPRRAMLCIALFVGQAFIYNGITFNLGTLMTTFFKVGASAVPIFIIIYAVGNWAGPLVLGRLFDTLGRKPMIGGTYLGSAALAVVLAGLFVSGSLNSVTFIIVVVAVFFLASAGASAAYLTASEIFPMETRARAIAFFYAVGTAIGGITGPLLFGRLIGSGSKGEVAVAFLIGGGVMALGGLAEIVLGVQAEGKQLEDIAKPLTVADAKGAGTSAAHTSETGSDYEHDSTSRGDEPDASPQSNRGRHHRERDAEGRARAAEHPAAAHKHLAADDQTPEQAGLGLISRHDEERAAFADTEANLLEQRAQEAAENVIAADHHPEAADQHREQVDSELLRRREMGDQARDHDRERMKARLTRESAGRRRYRPGPGNISSSRGWSVSSPLDEPLSFDSEIGSIHRALAEHGPTERRVLAQMVGSRYWGPGVFSRALRAATADGGIRRVSRSVFDLAAAGPRDEQPSSPAERG
jgi:MFS family permease